MFFMHVEKTAGTSLVSLLRSAFDESKICPQPPFGTWTWRAQEVPGYSLYWGHFTADFIEEMDPRGSRITMMRDPVDRIVSLYDYWRSHRWSHIRSALPPHPYNGPLIAKSGNLASFLTTDVEFVRERIYNRVARQLLGRRFEMLWPDQGRVIAESIKALEGFGWVGIVELFEPSVVLLSAALGLDESRFSERANPTHVRSDDDPVYERIEPTIPTEEELERILEGNRIDIALYTEGRKAVEDRIRLSRSA